MPTSRDRGNYHASHPKKVRSKERNRDSQRAYRLREKATIKSLTRQVQNLEKAVEGMSETVVNLVDDVSRIDEISNGNAEASRICEESLARILGLVRGLGGGDGDEDDHRGEHSNDCSANEVGDGGHENEEASVLGSFEPPIRGRPGSINLFLSPNSAWNSASEANQDNPQLQETRPGGESHRARISPYAAQAAHILATIRGEDLIHSPKLLFSAQYCLPQRTASLKNPSPVASSAPLWNGLSKYYIVSTQSMTRRQPSDSPIHIWTSNLLKTASWSCFLGRCQKQWTTTLRPFSTSMAQAPTSRGWMSLEILG
jgi:hypothetical protein